MVWPPWLSKFSSPQSLPVALSVAQDCISKETKANYGAPKGRLVVIPRKAEDVNTIHLNGLCVSRSTAAKQLAWGEEGEFNGTKRPYGTDRLRTPRCYEKRSQHGTERAVLCVA